MEPFVQTRVCWVHMAPATPMLKQSLRASGRVDKIHSPPLQLLGESPLGHWWLSHVPAVGHWKKLLSRRWRQWGARGSFKFKFKVGTAAECRGGPGRESCSSCSSWLQYRGWHRAAVWGCEERPHRLFCLPALQFGLFSLGLSPPWTSSVLAFSFQSCHCQLWRSLDCVCPASSYPRQRTISQQP